MAKYSKGAGKKVKEAMHEMKEGKLKSGRSGKKVTSKKQAIAIGLSEARERGAKVPAKGSKSSGGRSKAATKDRQTILDNCEFGEDAAQKAYDTALNTDEDLEAPLRELIIKQKAALRVGHDEVKRLRDMHKAIS